MASDSSMQYPLLRKLDFPIIRTAGGVPDALRQHREAVAHLLGPDEPGNWYAGTSLDLPPSPGLPSIFDFPEPVLPPLSPTEIVPRTPTPPPSPSPPPSPALPPAPAADTHAGLDVAAQKLVHELAGGKRRSLRNPGPLPPRAKTPSPAPSDDRASSTASPRPQGQKRKRTRCADDDGDDDDDDRSPSPSPSPPASKRAHTALPAPTSSIPAQPAAPPPPPPPPPRQQTPRGANVGLPLPSAVQREVAFISGMARLKNGYPSRNLLRKAPATAREISRKNGYLMTVARGGSLRRWFGDEGVFGMGMWRWLVGEHE